MTQFQIRERASRLTFRQGFRLLAASCHENRTLLVRAKQNFEAVLQPREARPQHQGMRDSSDCLTRCGYREMLTVALACLSLRFCRTALNKVGERTKA